MTGRILPLALLALLVSTASSAACGGASTPELRVETGSSEDPGERARNERALRQLQAQQEAERATPQGRVALVQRQGPGWLLSQVVLEPVDVDEATGLRIEAVSSSHSWILGDHLRVGDVLLRVDGMSVGDPQTLVHVWELLANAAAVQVDLQREGVERTVVIPLPAGR